MHPENQRWVTGDQFGLAFPADPAGLRSAGGTTFLTEAFRAAGALDADNAVTRISRFHEVAGGSTGRKVVLSVEYDKADARAWTPTCSSSSPATWTTRSVIAERRRWSRKCGSPRCHAYPGFRSRYPRCSSATITARSGTGILITERIRFGDNGIERQYHKCLDYEMPEPLEHYRALLTALARLVGTPIDPGACLPA